MCSNPIQGLGLSRQPQNLLPFEIILDVAAGARVLNEYI
jgi:hypothetical protein